MRRVLAIGAVALGAMLTPGVATAAETTYTLQVPTGTIGGYEVKQGLKGPIPKPPVNGYITKMETDIVDATTGDPVPISRLMLHHIVFLNVFKADNTCSGFTDFDSRTEISFGTAPQRFYAAGEERMKLALPPGYGYQHGTGDTWAMTYMLMNHRAVPDNALIQYKVTVESDPLTPVQPWWMDIKDCNADPIYNVRGRNAKGKSSKKGKDSKSKRKLGNPTNVITRDYTFPAGSRIVAGAGHVHGGANNLTLTKPNCGNAQIASSTPTWGLPDHPFYNVRPVLHEPGPINMSAFQTPTGIPVAPGETVRLNSSYDNTAPHVRVMGIFPVYVASDPAVTQPCGGPPTDLQTFSTNQPGRPGPIPFKIPLTGLDAAGQAVTIKKPPGKLEDLDSGDRTIVDDRFFNKPNIRVERGDVLKWRFSGVELHNLTLANGPLGIGTDNLDINRVYKERFNRPGTYRFFCSLHPVQMSQRVIVSKKKKTN